LVIFLGFGFHQQNLDLLQIRAVRTNAKRPMVATVLATVKGIDQKNDPALEARLAALGLPKPTVVPWEAGKLLADLRPTISMAAA
jgi:hypothetical protein